MLYLILSIAEASAAATSPAGWGDMMLYLILSTTGVALALPAGLALRRMLDSGARR